MARESTNPLLKALDSPYASFVQDGVLSDIAGFLDTGCYAFNAILSGSIYGGLPDNRSTAFAGRSTTGKSYFAQSIIRHFLQNEPMGMVVIFESEGAVESNAMKKFGIDPKRCIVVPVATIEETRTKIMNVARANAGLKKPYKLLLVIDSLSMLSSIKETEDIGKGSNKRDMSKPQLVKGMFRALTLELTKLSIPLIVTSHTYQTQGDYIPQEVLSGGQGLEYASSHIIFLSKKKLREDEQVVGNIITCRVAKSRITKPDRKVEVELSFETGLQKYSGLLDLGEQSGVLVKEDKKYKFPNGESAFESVVMREPEKWFTKDVLDLIDAWCQKNFRYGTGDTNPDETQDKKED